MVARNEKGKSYSTRFDLCLIIERSVDWQTHLCEEAHRGKIIFLLEKEWGNAASSTESRRKSERVSQRRRTIDAIAYERRNTTHSHHRLRTLIDLRANQETDSSNIHLANKRKERAHTMRFLLLIEEKSDRLKTSTAKDWWSRVLFKK